MQSALPNQRFFVFATAGVCVSLALILVGCTLLPGASAAQVPVESSQNNNPGSPSVPATGVVNIPTKPPPEVNITRQSLPQEDSVSNYSQTTGVGYSISVPNPFDFEVHIFIDDIYTMTADPGAVEIFGGLRGGTHTFSACQDTEMLSCSTPETIDIAEDFEWNLPAIEQPAAQPITAGNSSTPTVVSSTRVVETPAGFPTPRVMHGTFYTLKVFNPNPWYIFVFLDNVRLLTIPNQKYRIYRNLQPGEYELTFCRNKEMKRCFKTFKITISSDVELIAHP